MRRVVRRLAGQNRFHNRVVCTQFLLKKVELYGYEQFFERAIERGGGVIFCSTEARSAS